MKKTKRHNRRRGLGGEARLLLVRRRANIMSKQTQLAFFITDVHIDEETQNTPGVTVFSIVLSR